MAGIILQNISKLQKNHIFKENLNKILSIAETDESSDVTTTNYPSYTTRINSL